MRSLLSEFWMQPEEWRELWFCSYYNIHGPVCFLSSSSNLRFNKNATLATQLSTEAIMTHSHDLKQKLNQMHKIVINSLSKKREQKIAQVKLSKLMPRWTGPYRMTKTIND